MSGRYSDELLKALGYCGYEDLSPKGLSLADIQVEHARWAQKNFGDQPAWHALLGVVEEAGELCHAYLKREQGIRGTREEHDAEILDAVGDIVIFLINFCNREGIDLNKTVIETWGSVKVRDWKANPEDGEV